MTRSYNVYAKDFIVDLTQRWAGIDSLRSLTVKGGVYSFLSCSYVVSIVLLFMILEEINKRLINGSGVSYFSDYGEVILPQCSRQGRFCKQLIRSREHLRNVSACIALALGGLTNEIDLRTENLFIDVM